MAMKSLDVLLSLGRRKLGCATASCSQETPPLVDPSLARTVALLIKVRLGDAAA